MKREALGTLLAAAGALLYGLEPVVIKANPSNPISFAAFSALCASIILWLFLTASSQWREIRERPSHLKKAFLMGLFGTALAYISYSYGARLSTAINASLITRSEVLFSFLLSWIFLGERITKRLISYALIILSGLVLVITQGKLIEPHPGDLLLLLVPLFWQSGHVIAKRLPYSPYTIATLRNTFGFLILLTLAILTGPEFPKLAIAEGIIIALGQVIWYKSIKLINLSKATAIITPAPAVAIAIGIALGESFTPYHLAGFVLITLGTLGAAGIKSEVKT